MRYPLLLLLLALLGGCAAIPPAGPEHEGWVERQRELGAMDAWTLNGRVAVKLNGEGWNANLRWQQQGDDYRIRVFDPFGRTLALIEGDAEAAVLRTSEGERREAADPETLMDEEFGWHLPLTGMRYWLRGIPTRTGELEFLRLDGQGRPVLLQQAGWSMTYGDFASAHPLALPTRIGMEHRFITVRLAVADWSRGVP